MKEITIKQIQDSLQEQPNCNAYILSIAEADFGCEERQPDDELKVYIEYVTADGVSSCEVPENILIDQGIDEGSYIDINCIKNSL